MIIFDLKCICGFLFEGWFKSRADFDNQNSDCLISCPSCGNNKIHKILSPVAIHSTTYKKKEVNHAADKPDTSSVSALNYLRSVQEYVEKNFEDVGAKMASESLKIHYGVVEPRNIRGVVTDDEEKMLIQEGVELLKIPIVKKPPKTN